MHIGITTANKQAPFLMAIEYVVKLPDQDFVVAEKHNLIPSVYAGIAINENDMDHPQTVTYSGRSFIAIRSGEHSSSTASSRIRDLNQVNNLKEFENLVRNGQGEVKPVFIISNDGGPDENPHYSSVISHAIETFQFEISVLVTN